MPQSALGNAQATRLVPMVDSAIFKTETRAIVRFAMMHSALQIAVSFLCWDRRVVSHPAISYAPAIKPAPPSLTTLRGSATISSTALLELANAALPPIRRSARFGNRGETRRSYLHRKVSNLVRTFAFAPAQSTLPSRTASLINCATFMDTASPGLSTMSRELLL